MPNHCENILYVSGDKDEVWEFVQAHRNVDDEGGVMEPDFRADVSEPDPCEQGWHKLNWGTKWLPLHHTSGWIDNSSKCNMFKYEFTTPWTPPRTWLETAAAKHPHLEFKLVWAEGGNDFCGMQTYHGGRLEGDWNGTILDFESTSFLDDYFPHYLYEPGMEIGFFTIEFEDDAGTEIEWLYETDTLDFVMGTIRTGGRDD